MKELMVFRTLEKKWSKQDFNEYLKFQRNLKSRENKAQIVFFNDKIRLEFYYGSNSLWWTNLEWENKKIHQIKEIPRGKELILASNDFLKSHRLDNKYMKFKDIDYNTALSYDTKTRKTNQYITAINVDYEYEIEELPIFGSGAKAKILYDENKKIVEWYRFWRDIEPLEKRKPITPELAMRFFQKSPVFKKMQTRKVDVEFLEPKLGYYAFPPRINQKMLYPVYRIKGQIRNSKIYQNVCEYVPAVFESLDKLKEMKVYNGFEFCEDILHYLRK